MFWQIFFLPLAIVNTLYSIWTTVSWCFSRWNVIINSIVEIQKDLRYMGEAKPIETALCPPQNVFFLWWLRLQYCLLCNLSKRTSCMFVLRFWVWCEQQDKACVCPVGFYDCKLTGDHSVRPDTRSKKTYHGDVFYPPRGISDCFQWCNNSWTAYKNCRAELFSYKYPLPLEFAQCSFTR